jgi:hypothetical protein
MLPSEPHTHRLAKLLRSGNLPGNRSISFHLSYLGWQDISPNQANGQLGELTGSRALESNLEVDTLPLQLLRLNNFSRSLVEEGFASSTQPLAVTKPPRPTTAIS